MLCPNLEKKPYLKKYNDFQLSFLKVCLCPKVLYVGFPRSSHILTIKICYTYSIIVQCLVITVITCSCPSDYTHFGNECMVLNLKDQYSLIEQSVYKRALYIAPFLQLARWDWYSLNLFPILQSLAIAQSYTSLLAM